MTLAHIGGVPVEETLLGFAPVALLLFGAVGARAEQLAERLRRHRD